jgi:hypothetical protein
VTGSYKEKLIGGVAIVGRVKDAIVAHEGLEIEPVLGMTLDPAEAQMSNPNATAVGHDLLDGVATPAGTRGNCTIWVNLGILVEGIFPAFLKVDEGLPAPVLSDGIRKLCQ